MRIPISTYRIQFNPEFGFENAMEISEYLKNLGIDTLYASPIFKATAGSAHGYDVVDPNRLNPELGTENDFQNLSLMLISLKMGWLQDIVPNHMAYDYSNEYLQDVLENGMHSPYSHFFDINWDSVQVNFRHKLLAPFLGCPYGAALENQEIKIIYKNDGNLVADYFGSQFPIRIENYPVIFSDFPKNISEMEPDDAILNLTTIKNKYERSQQVRRIKIAIRRVYESEKKYKKLCDNRLHKLNGNKSNLDSFEGLDRLLRDQYYRLCYWKVANTSNNYRRFFTINGLISVNNQWYDVFLKTHKTIINFCKEGKFTGLRVDHIDGLYRPGEYLKRLRKKTDKTYTIVEKILEPGEKLPEEWHTEGTTGYDFMHMLTHLFIQKRNKKKFLQHYKTINPDETPPLQMIAEAKKMILTGNLNSRLESLTALVEPSIWRMRYGADATSPQIREALLQYICYLPVYRTYVSKLSIRKEDQETISNTISTCKKLKPEFEHVFECLETILQMQSTSHFSRTERTRWLEINRQIQQLSGPLMAKGLEDTILYRYTPLLSINEVGGNPFQFGIDADEFHAYLLERQKNYPYSMNATSTHDTKRGEDVRARLNVLSEITDIWFKKVSEWQKQNKKFKSNETPSLNTEYAIYQTIIGILVPKSNFTVSTVDRLVAYFVKFERESQLNTNWAEPNEMFEKNLENFIRKISDNQLNETFVRDIENFTLLIAFSGMINTLSQLVLKASLPGMPDFYQGTELLDLTLVDPDNRRPIDYEIRKKTLNQIIHKDIDTHTPINLLKDFTNGSIKLYVTHKILKARNEFPQLFLKGKYFPLSCIGEFTEQIFAFRRKYGKQELLVVVPRLFTTQFSENHLPVGNVWKDTSLQTGKRKKMKWNNLITGEVVEADSHILVAELLKNFPVAILINV